MPFVMVSISCTIPASTMAPSSTSSRSPEPATMLPQYKFELGSLIVTPSEIQAGQSVQARLPVKNVGSRQNAYIGTIYVDGHEYATKSTTLTPGNSDILTFSISGLGPGNHRLSVDNSKGSVKVYTIEKFEIANTQIDFPRYKRLEYFESPPVPHVSVHTFKSPAAPFFIRQIAFRILIPRHLKSWISRENSFTVPIQDMQQAL